MSYSQNLTRAEIAYDAFHAVDEEDEFPPFKDVPEDEKHRWMQAACISCDAWEAPHPRYLNVEYWRQANRDGHAKLREERTARRAAEMSICPGCAQIIEPDCCGCGSPKDRHGNPMNDGHFFIPMGCDCYRAKD